MPWASLWPTRNSETWLDPPEVGFWWHSRQDCALYKGPRPSERCSISSNVFWSVVWVASSTKPLLLLSNPVGASETGGAKERSPRDKKREMLVSSFMGTSLQAAG